LKNLAPTVLSTVHLNSELQQQAGMYFNRNEDGHNLFAEQRGGREQAYLFNMYGSLLALDTSELQHVFGIKKLTPTALHRLPLDYLADTLRNSHEVYQSYFKDDSRYPPNISWRARATALDLGANAAEANRYMRIVDVAFGCLSYHAELVADGIRLTPRTYEVQPTTMHRNLTSLAKLNLLMFRRTQDDFVVRLAHEHLTDLDVVHAPRFFGFFVY
jgi:hypothetical protein